MDTTSSPGSTALGSTIHAGPDPARPDPAQRRQIRRVLVSSFIGSLIEWYDFYLFGLASALVFNQLFFPDFSSAAGTLASFATLAIGFFARPIGGAIWGHYGDKVGRKKMLVLSIILMGIGTTLIGLLPTYAQIGIAAPILLVVLRTLQGVAAGGEWGGAVLIAMEHSRRRRGFSTSIPQMGLTGGILLATGVFALLTQLPSDALLSWGWRLPFILSSVLVVVGLWIRLGVHESPVFLEAQQKAATTEVERAPIVEVLRRPRMLLIAIALVVGPFAVSSIYSTYAAAYGLQTGFTRAEMSSVVLVSAAIGFLGQPIFGTLSDYWGRRNVTLIGLAMQAVSVVFFFNDLNSGNLAALYVSMAAIAIGHSICYSPVAAWLGELFPTRLRYTGASLGYQIAGSIGGLTPLICAALLIAGGGTFNTGYIVAFGIAVNVLAFVAAIAAPETSKDVL